MRRVTAVCLSLFVLAGVCHGAELAEPMLLHPVLVHDGDGCDVFARCPTRKVMPEADLAAEPDLVRADHIALAAARNETEQVSLVIRPDAALRGVTVAFSAMTGADGRAIADAWSWRRVVAVPVEASTVWYGVGGWETGRIPDPLLPGKPFDAPAGENSTLLLEVAVPRDAAPGLYEGAVTVRAEGMDDITVPLRVAVWDITLPDRPTLQTAVCGVQAGYPDLCRMLFDDGVTCLKYGSTAITLNTDPEAGERVKDFSAYDADLTFLIDELGYECVTLPPSLLGSQGTVNKSYLSLGCAVGDDAFWPHHDAFLRQMAGHYRDKGWAGNVVYYMMDEIQPNLNDIAAGVGRGAKRAFPEMPCMLITHQMPDALAGSIDIWCVPWHFFATRSEDVHRWDELRARGLHLWSYMNSLYVLNADWNPGAMRLFGPVLAKYGYEGALWWQMRYYNGMDPWAKGLATMKDTKRNRLFHGSGYFLYPAAEDAPGWHSSLRWENYVQGEHEYELMHMLHTRWTRVARALGPKADDTAFSADLAMRWWGSLLATEFRVQTFRRDTAYIQRFRQLLAHEVEHILAPPYALVDCESDDACLMESDVVHVRGVCAPGTRVTVAGTPVADYAEDKAFVFVANVPVEEGATLIPIVLRDGDGNEKTLYREVRRVPASE